MPVSICFPNSGLISRWTGGGLSNGGLQLFNQTPSTGTNSVAYYVKDGVSSPNTSTYWSQELGTRAWFEVKLTPFSIVPSSILIKVHGEYGGAFSNPRLQQTKLLYKIEDNPGFHPAIENSPISTGIVNILLGAENTPGTTTGNLSIIEANRDSFSSGLGGIPTLSGEIVWSASLGTSTDVYELQIDVSGDQSSFGNITLYLEGPSTPTASGTIPLYTTASITDSGTIPLFMDTYATSSGNIDLYIAGPIESSGTISLYTLSSVTDSGSVDLYTAGLGVVSGQLDLYTAGPIEESGTLDLFTWGHILSSGSLDLFLQAHITSSGTIDLFTGGLITTSGSLPLYITTPLPDSGMMNLFIYGGPIGTERSGQLPLWMWSSTNSGTYSVTDLYLENTQGFNPAHTLNLFIQGPSFQSSTSSMNLVVYQQTDVSGGLDLFIQNAYEYSSGTLPLYLEAPEGTLGAVPISGTMNLFINREYNSDANNLALYLKNKDFDSGILSLYTAGANIPNSSISLYVAGKTTPFGSILLYTHGW